MKFRLVRCVVLLASALLLLGALGPASAASGPDWSGRWTVELICTLPNCNAHGRGSSISSRTAPP